MPLVRRVPKRGFTNALFKKEYQIVNLKDLPRAGKDEITVDLMKISGLIKSEKKPVKVLGVGDLKKAYTVYAHKFSESAKKKIEEAGGKAIILEIK